MEERERERRTEEKERLFDRLLVVVGGTCGDFLCDSGCFDGYGPSLERQRRDDDGRERLREGVGEGRPGEIIVGKCLELNLV